MVSRQLMRSAVSGRTQPGLAGILTCAGLKKSGHRREISANRIETKSKKTLL
jgi:hypothetical protein